jgi:hypothetical protein
MDPAQEWESAEGTYKGEMILGGRYLAVSVSGPMMGQTFEGMGCIGYDNITGKHFSAWIDSMSTAMMTSHGTCSPDHKTLTFEGEMIDPMTKKPCKHKMVYTIKDNDSFTMKMWSPSMSNGEMFECMTIDYTRVN